MVSMLFEFSGDKVKKTSLRCLQGGSGIFWQE